MKNKNSENGNAGHRLGARFWVFFWVSVSIFVTIGFIGMCRYEPSAYLPQSPDNPRQVSPYLTHKLGPDFFNQVQLDEPFNLEIEQAGLNDILSRMPWPQPLGDAAFSSPLIVFNSGVIYMMGTLEYKGISSVLTIRAEPLMTDDKQVNLNIQSIHLGMLPVTRLVSKLANKAFADNLPAFEGEPEAEQMVRGILQNGPFDPVFKINSHKVRISEFSLTGGLLTLTCVPVGPTSEQ